MTIVKHGEFDEYVKLETKLLYKTSYGANGGGRLYANINEVVYDLRYAGKPDIGDVQSEWINPISVTWTRYHLYEARQISKFNPEKDIWN